MIDLRRLQYGSAILTGGHHRGFDAGASQKFEQRDRAWVCLDSSRKTFVDQFILPVTETADGFSRWRSFGGSFRQENSARIEEIAYPGVSQLPIHVVRIICNRVEREERLSLLACRFLEVFVEHHFPTCRMDAGRIRDDSVHVEQNGLVASTGCGTGFHSVVDNLRTCVW